MAKQIVVLAPQRSGTNYLEQLIRHNFENIKISNQDSSYIWKHRAYPEDVKDKLTNNNLHFVVHKNPYKWIESLMKYNADLDKRFGGAKDQYANKYKDKQEGDILHKDRRGRESNLGGACRLYNDFYNNWFDQSYVKIIPIRYEDLLVENTRNAILQSFVSEHGLKRKNNKQWQNPEKVGQSDKWTPEMTRKYLDLEHFNKLNQEHIDLVNKYIDSKWFDQFNYPLVEKKGWDINKRKN